jgi:hypothetical protein
MKHDAPRHSEILPAAPADAASGNAGRSRYRGEAITISTGLLVASVANAFAPRRTTDPAMRTVCSCGVIPVPGIV